MTGLSPTEAFRRSKRRLLLEEGTSAAQRRVVPFRVFDRGPCPACRRRVVTGDGQEERALMISLPSGVTWWHQACRAAALQQLREEREEGAGQ